MHILTHCVNNQTMFTTVIRVLILYLVVLICLRIMGKRQMGEMQPYELVITLIIADLATIPMAQHNVPLFKGIIPVLVLVVIQFSLAFLAQKSVFFRKAITGKSVIIVNPDGVDFKELKKLSMNLSDLIELIRQESYVGLEDVLYVIAETNGKMSIIPKAASSPLNSTDMKIAKEENALPVAVIADGKLMKTNSQLISVTADRIESFMKQLCGEDCKIKDVCVFTLDPNGKAFIQKYGSSAISATVNFKGNEL